MKWTFSTVSEWSLFQCCLDRRRESERQHHTQNPPSVISHLTDIMNPPVLRHQLCRSRAQLAALYWLNASARQATTSSITPSLSTTNVTTAILKRSRATNQSCFRNKVTQASSISHVVRAIPHTALDDSWNDDVIERECCLTSRPDWKGGKGEKYSRKTEECSMTQKPPLIQEDIVPPAPSAHKLSRCPISTAQPSTTVPPPYLNFQNARPFSEMPSPPSLPIIGTMWMHMPGGPLYGLTFEEKMRRMEERYGPIFHETVVLGFNMLHVYRPEDIEAVYRVQGSRPRREAFRCLHKYNEVYSDGVQGLLTSQGEAWHELRSQSQAKMMKPKSASAYIPLHNAVADDFVAAVDRLRDPSGIIEDLLPELYKFAVEGIGCVCFNRRVGALDADIPADSDTYRFIRAVNDVMEVSHSELKKLFLFRHSSSFKKLSRAQSFIRKLSHQEAVRTLETFQETGREMDGESGDLIPYLMTKTALSEQQVMTIISEFFFGGVDTTSHLLGFALYCLATNPQAQDALLQEIDRLVPGSDVISANTLGRMSYLKAFTKETFRMMPVTPGNGRTLERDVVLNGYHVPAGMFVGLHHDWAGKSEKYVPEAHRFEPRRWLRGDKSPLGHVHPFVVMPFGFGARACVGRRFAEQEYSLALIKLLLKYRVEYASTENLWYDMCVINKPMSALKFKFIPRN